MRGLTIAAILTAGAVVAAGCGDDDSEEAGGGDGGGQSGLYGGGPGDDEQKDGGQGQNGGEGEDGGEADGGEGDGGEGEGGGAGAGTRLALAADPGGALRFDKSSLRAKAGRVTIVFDNPSQIPHAVEVEGKGVEEETETVTGGGARLSVDLEPGEYTFYCPVGNHEQAGMAGKLTVR
jgi:plastocyanin